MDNTEHKLINKIDAYHTTVKDVVQAQQQYKKELDLLKTRLVSPDAENTQLKI